MLFDYHRKQYYSIPYEARSHGQVVESEDSCLRGRGFESGHR